MDIIPLVSSSIVQQWSSVQTAVSGHRIKNRSIGGTASSYWVEPITRVLAEDTPKIHQIMSGFIAAVMSG